MVAKCPKDTSFLSKYLPIIITLLISLSGLAVTWGASKAKADYMETRLVEISIGLESTKERLQKREIDSAGESVMLQKIAQDIEEIKRDLKELRKTNGR